MAVRESPIHPMNPALRDRLVSAIADTAQDWLDPSYGMRLEAEQNTLRASNRFTEEALIFAITQQMSQLSQDSLNRWIPRVLSQVPRNVGVLNPGNIPFAGLQDFLAVILSGHSYLGTVSSRSPHLLSAFAADLASRVNDYSARFESLDVLLKDAEALILSGTDDTVRLVRLRAHKSGIDDTRLLVRGHRYSVAVVSGDETKDEYARLAEDILLHEGLGCRSVAIVFAPAGVSPDSLLDVMAHYRATFPPHPETVAALKMKQALLKAVDAPHAFGEGFEFLVSLGEAEVQQPGHVRWTEYTKMETVQEWVSGHSESLQLIVTGERTAIGSSGAVERVSFGQAQRPELGWAQDGVDIRSFLESL